MPAVVCECMCVKPSVVYFVALAVARDPFTINSKQYVPSLGKIEGKGGSHQVL